MDAGEIMAALLATSALHTGGHFDAAAKSTKSVPMHLDLKNMAEAWSDKGLSDSEANQIDSAGFTAQDKVTGRANNKALSTATGLYKLAYAGGSAKMMGGKGNDDFDWMKQHGGKYAKEAAVISAVSDLLHGMGAINNGRLEFIAPEGAPGLAYTRRW